MGDRKDDYVIVLDLIQHTVANKKYDKLKYGNTQLDVNEFGGTNWAWCLLGNMGANPSMKGQLEFMATDILQARQTMPHMKGVGIISEGTRDNPVLYDLIFDMAWVDDDFDANTCLDSYIERRYGKTSDNLKEAWQILENTVYNYGIRRTPTMWMFKGLMPHEKNTSTIPYGAENLEKAIELMLSEYDELKDLETYRYDLTEMMRQHVSNYGVLVYNKIHAAIASGDVETYAKYRDLFLNAMDVTNLVQATQIDQLGGQWIGLARDRAAEYDDFTRDVFEMNAKAQITSWGSRTAHESLIEYGHKDYEGIFLDVYKAIWQDFFDRQDANYATGADMNNRNYVEYFDTFWKWVLQETDYTREPITDPAAYKAIADRVLKECSVEGLEDPNAGNIALPALLSAANTDLSVKEMKKATDGSDETAIVLKGKDGAPVLNLDLMGSFTLSKAEVRTPRNEKAIALSMEVSADGENWTAFNGSITGNISAINLKNTSGRYVRLQAKDGVSDLSLAEVRIYGSRNNPDNDVVRDLVSLAESLDASKSDAAAKDAFDKALVKVKSDLANNANPDILNDSYWALYDAITKLNLNGDTENPGPVNPGPDNPKPNTPGSGSGSIVKPAEGTIMHRLYNPNSGEHFYTASDNEKNTLVSLGWVHEGDGWKAPASSAHPVYRLYNPNAGDHHYTRSENERNTLVALGWKDEGIGWYSDEKQNVPLYRLYNPNAKAGAHHYTTDAHESRVLADLGWKEEGISWYGLN